ncbi:DNA polymerase III alpha subunit [Lachnospiraceae bacterium TWA4]|nr:DNA polymerase III alpha subunit [Lachnospiraceae bacterium TWA4]
MHGVKEGKTTRTGNADGVRYLFYFLGLRTLTVIQNAQNLVNRNGEILDINQIDYNDKAVLDHIGTGKTEGVFQLESGGMKNFMKELKPQSLEDIIAGISLYRPGPMEFIPKYIKGKNNQDQITYDCEALEDILKPTYGCMVYQEQVMRVVRDLAGYSLGRSDLVRRAMSKKKMAVMEKERQNFVYGNEEEGVKGCINNGISEQVANKIYDEMIDFAKYAFNKSHAACYAVVSYQTAYLKHYYPMEYMAALLNSVIENIVKTTGYIGVCKEMGIDILPPDINEGDWGFTVSDKGIRYGLSAVKNVGRSVVENIVLERQKGGPFTSLKDFIYRLVQKDVNKRTVENFIKAGALDSLPGNRKQKLAVYAGIMDRKTKEDKTMISGQMSLFDLMGDSTPLIEEKFPSVEEYGKEELLAFEKEVLGIYVSGHPLDSHIDLWKKYTNATAAQFKPDDETGQFGVFSGSRMVVGGIISEISIKYTKNNQRMAFVTLEDVTGSVEVIFFPKDFDKNGGYLQEERKVFMMGHADVSGETAAKLICDKVIPFEEVPRQLWLQFQNKEDYVKNMDLLEELKNYEGNSQVVIYLAKERAKKTLDSSYNISLSKPLLDKLYGFIGEENVKVVDIPIAKLQEMH